MENELLKDLNGESDYFKDVPGEKDMDMLTAVDFNLEDTMEVPPVEGENHD